MSYQWNIFNFLISYVLVQVVQSMSKPIKVIPQCLYGNQCVQMCIDPTCPKQGFICSSGVDKKNCCGLIHLNCQKMKWTQFNNIICDNPNTKLPILYQFQEIMQNLFSNLITKISQEHQAFKKWLSLYGYSSQTMDYINLINDDKCNSITGAYSHQIISEIFMNQEKQIQVNFNTDQCLKIQKQFQNLLEQMKDLYSSDVKDKIDKLSTISTVHSVPEIIIIDSKIQSLRAQFNFIKTLFPKQNLKSLNLVYRASQNNFSTFEFHKICDNIPNTLTVIQTQYGKVIGGYTPLCWNSNKKSWAADKTNQTFLFSLTLKEKFNLNLAQFAIACNPDKGPIFGCCDICVVDKGNIQKCNAQFPISYNNFKHTRSADTCNLFTGNSKGRFNTREWQVYQVSFYSE